MQVGDLLQGEVLLCSFFAMSMILLEVPASNSWLTLYWLENFSSWGTSEGTTFSKNVPISSAHALLAARASRILILNPKCPEDSYIPAGPLEELVHTIVSGEQQGGWCMGSGAECGVSESIEVAVPL